MVAATVLIPTHDHGETLRYSIPTALRQTVEDIEIFIVGDAVPDVTRAIVRDFASSDRRVRFFDFPKGPSRGELYRHQVLEEARGEIVCYLFDDDLWLPDHIVVVQELLRDADFAVTLPVVVGSGGEIFASFVDLARPLHRRLFTNSRSGTVSEPTCAAHTMALYRRLPHGWQTTPPGLAPDKFMWAQCLADPSTIARSSDRPTAIIFRDPPRRGWPLSRRLDELREWSGRLSDPQFLRDVARAEEAQRLPDAVLRGYEISLRLPFGRALARLVKKALAPRSGPAGE